MFNQYNYHQLCDELGAMDADLQQIITHYGYPPFWERENTFESLVHIILEQQVSLASALSALNKLREKVTNVTPKNVMRLTDDELRACYFSRQKTLYIRHLAENIQNGHINLTELKLLDDEAIRKKLTSIKGIGNWTVDIYLIFIVHHTDVFPIGDLAVRNSLKKVKSIPNASFDDVLAIAEQWRPLRTIATMILWHSYLEERRKKQH